MRVPHWMRARRAARGRPREHRSKRGARLAHRARRTVATDHWMSRAVNREHRGDFDRLVRERYGDAGFMPSPATGRPILRPGLVAELRHDPDPHIRGMADFAYNTPEQRALRRALGSRTGRERGY